MERLPNLENLITRFLSNKEIISEKKAENKEILEEVDLLMAQEGISEHEFVLDEKLIRVIRKTKVKKKLDKSGLASVLGVTTADLTTEGMVELAEDGQLTTQHIKDFTQEEKRIEIKVKKRKLKKKGE